MDIGIGIIMNTHRRPDLPVPVGADTIPPSIPDTQYKPRCSRDQHGKKVPAAGGMKGPSGNIKYSECCMKNKEKNIKYGIPHHKTEDIKDNL